ISLTGAEAGIWTDADYTRARIIKVESKRVVKELDKAKAAGLTPILINDTTAWQSWPLDKLLFIATYRLPREVEACKTARAKLIQHVATKYLVNSTTISGLGTVRWARLAGFLSHDMSPETRLAWIKALRGAFADSPEAFLTLNAVEIDNLIAALRRLGDKETAELSATLTRKTTEWQSWPPEALVELARAASQAASKEACTRLIDHIAAKYLVSTAGVRLLTCQHWRSLAESLSRSLSVEQRTQWIAKLKAAFAAGPADLKALKFKGLRALGMALARLEKGAASDVVLAWFKENDDATLAKVSAGDLTNVALLLSSASDAQKAEVMARFDPRWEADHAAKPLEWRQSAAVSAAWGRMHNLDKAKAWAMRSYQGALGTEEARNAADAATLRGIAGVLEDVGLTGKGTGYAGYAAAAAKVVREGKLGGLTRYTYYVMGLPLGTPETRQTVQAELVDSQGHVRLGGAKLLTMAHASIHDVKPWLTFLDARLAASAGGDAKALWLIARGYAESVAAGEASPMRGKKFYNQALATATSASCKYLALKELIGGYVEIAKHDRAVSVLDSVAGQFAGTEQADKLALLRTEIVQAKAAHAVRRSQRKARLAERAEDTWKRELRRRLASAEARGDGEATRRIRRILGQ
ncbi:hypothetical protein LCGC14_1916420, partial [marine sediment metagenome]